MEAIHFKRALFHYAKLKIGASEELFFLSNCQISIVNSQLATCKWQLATGNSQLENCNSQLVHYLFHTHFLLYIKNTIAIKN